MKKHCVCGYEFGGLMKYCPYCGTVRTERDAKERDVLRAFVRNVATIVDGPNPSQRTNAEKVEYVRRCVQIIDEAYPGITK